MTAAGKRFRRDLDQAQVNVAIEVAEIVRDALLGKGIRNAANYPCLEPEVCKILEP